jgi:NACHT domain
MPLTEPLVYWLVKGSRDTCGFGIDRFTLQGRSHLQPVHAENTAKTMNGKQNQQEHMRHAFGLLASVELGQWPVWNGPGDSLYLRCRVETLAGLLDLVPRSQMPLLEEIADAWMRTFPGTDPVTAKQLRDVARAVLNPVRGADGGGANDSGLWRALALVGPGTPRPDSLQQHASGTFDQTEAYRQCAVGLGVWFDQLKTARWTRLPSSVPGESPVEIEKVYVELYAIPETDTNIELANLALPHRMARQHLSNQYPVVDVPTMLARTLDRCVVIGEPGSGKSTMTQWLAWAVHGGKCPDFKAALVVKLGAFARELAENPDVSVVEFFFQSLRTKIDDWREPADALRRIAAERRDFLLLLDGWDEVPVPQREAVRERIAAEYDYFVTVVTSRASGLPHQLQEGDRVDVYRIAGLAERSRDELARKLVAAQGHPELIEPVLHRIRSEPDLREMAANPFLLGLLVRVLSRSDSSNVPLRTLADVYRQVTNWVKDQYNQFRADDAKLIADHIVGLRRLSHWLLFGPGRPRYVFSRQELSESMFGSEEPVRRSRFVDQTDPVYDEYAFLHATLQEYFAAAHADNLSNSELDDFLDRAFRSYSRLIVLEFLAGGHGAAAARCRQRCVLWLQDRDRFGQTALRIARMAGAGRWPEDALVQSVRDELWTAIRANHDLALTKLAVEALAELDATGLARRARATTGLDNWAIQCIVDAVPASVARDEQLDELLSGEWRDYAGFDARGGATHQDFDAIRAVLENPSSAEDDLREAAIHAGAAGDASLVPPLVNLLSEDFRFPAVQETVLDSLGAIGGREAVDALVGVVLGMPRLTKDAVTAAIGVLRHYGHNKKALDPVGRDRLLRRLCVVPADAGKTEPILRALQACPIREGDAVIEQIAVDGTASAGVRATAVFALMGVVDRSRLQRLIRTIASEPLGEVVDAMLLLALIRSLAVPREWLEAKVTATGDRAKLRTLLPSYLLTLANVHGPDRLAALGYLNREVSAVLKDPGATGDGRLAAWEHALTQGPLQREWLTEETFQRGLDELVRFAASPNSVPTTRVRLASCVVGQFRTMTARTALKDALSAALQFQETGQGDLGAVPLVIANRLADVAPGELLRYPPDCDPVNAVLQTRAVERGWMIFRDRITDAEGDEIATIKTAEPAAIVPEACDLKTIAEQLPEASRRALLSYWWMVRDGGPCASGDTLQRIYDATASCRDSGDGSDAAYLRMLYPDDLPAFETWKKTLNRILKQFAGQPAALAQLHRIGLGRRHKR